MTRPRNRTGEHQAKAALMGRRTPGQLPATCWCEATVVRVPVEHIVAGRTASCGRRHCRPPERQAA